MLLSIVIPVYNVEAYVEKCIRSCVQQNVSTDLFEIIVVNDGSLDKSLAICEELQQEISNLYIISQENKGLSGARNTGLRQAKGDYVWFIDSDDWIDENCLNKIFENVLRYKSEIFWLGHRVVFNDKVYDSFRPKVIDTPIDGMQFFQTCLNELFYIWKFVYKRSFLLENELFFYEGIIYEDLEFTPRALFKARTCLTISELYYNYLMRNGSIINNFTHKNIDHLFFIYKRLRTFMIENEVPTSFYQSCYKSIVNSAVNSLRIAVRFNLDISDQIITEIKSFEVANFLESKQKRKLNFIQKHPKLFIYSWKLLYRLKGLVKR